MSPGAYCLDLENVFPGESHLFGPLLGAAVVGIYLLPGVLEAAGDRTVLPWLLGEDGVYEAVGTLSCLAAGILFFNLWLMAPLPSEKRTLFGRRNVVFAALAVGLLLIFGEEMNWGERIFATSPPSWAYEWNTGGEIALHVVGGAIVPMLVGGVLSAAALFFLSLLPVLNRTLPRVSNFTRRWDVPVASGTIAWTTAILFAFGILRIGACRIGHFQSEQFEAAIQVLALVFAAEQTWMRRDRLPSDAIVKVASATSLIVVSFAVWFGWLMTTSNRVAANFEFVTALHSDGGRSMAEKERHLRRCLQWDPDYVDAVCMLAGIWMGRGELKPADELLSAARERGPASPFVESAMAELRYRQGRKREAIEHVERSLALNPHHVETRLFAITLLREVGNAEEAQSHLRYLQLHLPEDHDLRRQNPEFRSRP